jgi:hypothetical protein
MYGLFQVKKIVPNNEVTCKEVTSQVDKPNVIYIVLQRLSQSNGSDNV